MNAIEKIVMYAIGVAAMVNLVIISALLTDQNLQQNDIDGLKKSVVQINDEPLPEPKTPDNDEPLNDKQQRALRDIENKAYFKGWNNGYERRSEERRAYNETEKNCDICGKVEGHRCVSVESKLILYRSCFIKIYSLREFYPTDMPWAFFIKKDSVVYRSARFATRHAAEAESKRVIDKHFAE